MSIPPLVCNTPPPPEQCDDDRDAEDFDIQYNLSQEDEEEGNNYNYGTYSEYMYPTSTSSNIDQDIWSSNISKKTDEKLSNNILEDKKDPITVVPKSDSSSISKLICEDTILEDLNLKLENQNDDNFIEQNTNKLDIQTFENDCNEDISKQLTDDMQLTDDIEKNLDENQFTITQDFHETILVTDDAKSSDKNEEFIVEEPIVKEYTQEGFDMDTKESDKIEKDMENESTDDIRTNITEIEESKTSIVDHIDIMPTELKLENLADDDFGEFDDFQFKSSESNAPASITYCDDPWKNEVSKNTDFENFTANFDDNTLCSIDNLDKNKAGERVDQVINETDDFGDFDDFKSSNCNIETTSIKSEPTQNVPVLSLYSPDNEIQIIESINSVLNSIFTSEISEFDTDFEGKLESSLNETWGHLVDTDVRQSYIVNWNNSLGQKSLLKALCIDSRNILFGPKWNTNMPKYAANLTVAPLQPQKPVTPTNTRNADEKSGENTATKETSSWTDPFTSDGKEYTYAEALLLDLEHLMATLDQMAHKHSSFKISELLTNACNSENENTATITRPASLDVFTNGMSSDIGHVYSSTLSVQPIRQINLPDTHIFTPTDSETPRSKTIHYDQGPPVLVPQQSDASRPLEELNSKPKSDLPVQSSGNDEDYWEFQDFKSSNRNDASSINQVINKCTPDNGSLPQVMSASEIQILQPIKVEPIAPALNWPDPGEVKDTFDDFSEFVSNTSWTNEKTNTANQSDSHLNTKAEGRTEVLEDDFETFQCAPSLKCTVATTDNIYQTTAKVNHRDFEDFSQHFIDTSDISPSKTDGIIISKQTLVQNESSLPGSDNFTTIKDSNEKTSPVTNLSSNQSINSTIMQPAIANTSASQRNQQKTGQILQPLSLESYSQINWPSPGIDLQDLSRFNPVESLQSFKTDLNTGGSSRVASPAHKNVITSRNEIPDEDIWGEFVSSKPKQQQVQTKKIAVFADDDEWTDFVSSPSVKPQNGLNTISLNVQTNLNIQKTLGPNKFPTKNHLPMDIPTLKYVTPKSTSRGLYNEKHFQNL